MHNFAPDRPQLLLDTNRCKKNIKKMVTKCRESLTELRPHFKTHQSLQVGRWFRDQGVTGITVSTPAMGQYFAQDGWDDITIAFPFYRSQLHAVKELQEKASIRLFIHNADDIHFLERELDKPFRFYIEIDNGYKRSGISPEDKATIGAILDAAKSGDCARFHGFYMHDGRTYQSRSKDSILQSIQSSAAVMKGLKEIYPDAVITMGDTPSASALPSFDFLDECTAGNFVFFDWMQVLIGSCTVDDIALFHVLPIAQPFPDENRAICHGGAVHCSKDYVLDKDGSKNYGQLVEYDPSKPSKVLNGKLASLSQEHGMLAIAKKAKKILTDDHICIAPIHSCLTANLYDRYTTTTGEYIHKRVLS
jgi:D-serine deaminase-like pyridoxal phosphate-dependent protein